MMMVTLLQFFSDIGDETKLIEGICRGILKTRVSTYEGIGSTLRTCMIDSGKQAELW